MTLALALCPALAKGTPAIRLVVQSPPWTCTCVCSAAGHLLEDWMSRANAVFVQCQSHPGVLAFVLDQWSELLESGGGIQAGVQLHMPKPVLDWLSDKTNVRAQPRVTPVCLVKHSTGDCR